jgi:tetratricopeptide (TPR) repeat protein
MESSHQLPLSKASLRKRQRKLLETLRIFPEHMSAKFQLGLALARNQQYDEAIPALRNALAFLPNLPTLHEYLGISLLRTRKIADAIEQLILFVDAAPTDAEGHYFLGVALRSNGREDEAHAQFLEALRLRPNNEQFEAAAHPGETRGPAEETFGPKPEDGSIAENTYTNKFFGFAYEFPKGWTVMSSEAAQATVEMGTVLMSTGDPTDQDTKQVALRKGYLLLFVLEGRVKNQPFTVSSVQISALDARAVSQLSPQSLLKSVAERLQQTGAIIQGTGSPEKLLLGGRDFWKINVTIPIGTGTRYGSELVTFDKEFALMFALSTTDQASLGQMEHTLQSVRFFGNRD